MARCRASAACFEDFVYDEQGNPLTNTFMDYLLPTAADVPLMEYGHVETPASTPGDYKGVGEGAQSARRPRCERGERRARARGRDVPIAPFTPVRIIEALTAAGR